MKETKKLVTALGRAGYTVSKRRGHYRVDTEQGPVFFPATPSDNYRGLLNTRAELRRKGISI